MRATRRMLQIEGLECRDVPAAVGSLFSSAVAIAPPSHANAITGATTLPGNLTREQADVARTAKESAKDIAVNQGGSQSPGKEQRDTSIPIQQTAQGKSDQGVKDRIDPGSRQEAEKSNKSQESVPGKKQTEKASQGQNLGQEISTEKGNWSKPNQKGLDSGSLQEAGKAGNQPADFLQKLGKGDETQDSGSHQHPGKQGGVDSKVSDEGKQSEKADKSSKDQGQSSQGQAQTGQAGRQTQQVPRNEQQPAEKARQVSQTGASGKAQQATAGVDKFQVIDAVFSCGVPFQIRER